MKKSEKKAYFIVGIIAVSLMLILSSLHIYNPIHPDFDPFPTGTYEFKDAEKELEISITCDGENQAPYGNLKYSGKEYEIELHSKAESMHVYIKGENDSDFSFWLVFDYKEKANGNVKIKNIKCLNDPSIQFKPNRIILKKVL